MGAVDVEGAAEEGLEDVDGEDPADEGLAMATTVTQSARDWATHCASERPSQGLPRASRAVSYPAKEAAQESLATRARRAWGSAWQARSGARPAQRQEARQTAAWRAGRASVHGRSDQGHVEAQHDRRARRMASTMEVVVPPEFPNELHVQCLHHG
jgi:hypothetical protein